MNKVLLFSLIYVSSVFIASVSQVLLKVSARKPHKSRIFEYLNWRVITAYGMFFLSMLVTMFALREVPLTLANLLEGSGYIFILVLSSLFLQEKITKDKVIGSLLILTGIAVYAYF